MLPTLLPEMSWTLVSVVSVCRFDGFLTANVDLDGELGRIYSLTQESEQDANGESGTTHPPHVLGT